VERLVSRLARAADLPIPVACMTLRHSYAVDCLRHGMSVVQLQQNLGHRNLETTLDYQRFIPPDNTVSPAEHFSEDTVQHKFKTPAVSLHGSLPPEWPFPSMLSPVQQFLKTLKTRISGRFLALRAFATKAINTS
jgi:hypothetical protein